MGKMMAAAESKIAKQFGSKLRKAGWHSYTDEETGRVVTNAYERELGKLEQISGLQCEVVSPAPEANVCCRIGPKLVQG